MPLRNACFISYRHGQYELMKEFITDFCDALSGELEPMLRHGGVYLDHHRLRGGDFYNQALARNLFESATMVMVYTPTYFDSEHTYCAREYAAMAALEERRIALLQGAGKTPHGLIIPIILRGARYLPEEIKLHRQYHDFEGFQLGSRRLSRHPRFAPVVRDIAGYICERFQELEDLPSDTFEGGDTFQLPEESAILALLGAAGCFRLPFPRGEISCQPQVLSARS